MPSLVEVSAPSRLHFGLFSFGCADRPQFGGLGVMVDQPRLRLRIRAAERLMVSGHDADRATTVARQIAVRLAIEPQWQIEILTAPPSHVGLGSGTQLAMALAGAILALRGEAWPEVEHWLTLTGRGKRSMVGVYGFLNGGLIVEAGKHAAQPIAPLVAQCPLPESWRFVLITRSTRPGLHGEAERIAFERLAPVPKAVSDTLHAIACDELLLAARRADALAFANALERFNNLAGSSFAALQGGHYTPTAQHVINELRALGVSGYAQTSWGPTVCVPFGSSATAEAFAQAWCTTHDDRVLLTATANAGAQVRIVAS